MLSFMSSTVTPSVELSSYRDQHFKVYIMVSLFYFLTKVGHLCQTKIFTMLV